MKSTILNEEEIRSNIIIPLLNDIGFTYDELKLETSFSIQLGRGVYDIKNDQRRFIGGRLDILCKADKKNLFVIELKAEDVKIDKDKDRKQGLTYARLLDPMPPYVILTNCISTFIYETTTGNEVDSDFVGLNGFKPALEAEINLKYQALKTFVGYSNENLHIFCKNFNNEYLNNFRSCSGDTVEQELQKKYIPDTYVERGNITDLFKNFLSQDELCTFPVIGESGVGKTNTIIKLFEKFSEYPSIFYSGTLLGDSFFNELKFDFNLEFSPNETELSLLKKISTLAENQNKPFIIFIDALDEWIAQDRIKQLENLTKVLVRYGIKLCISCKDLIWNSFLIQREIPTYFSQYLFSVPPLENFSAAEFKQALIKYSQKLDLKYKTTSNELFNPFSLRISCEVAYSKNIEIELSQNSRETLSIFIDQKMSKTGELNKLKRYIKSISLILLQQDVIQIDEDQIRNSLKLGINEELPVELFSSNLLYRNKSVGNQNIYIGFYFSKIRDHIISMDVLALDNKGTENRIKSIIYNLDTFIGENAVNYFFRTGTQNEQEDCIAAFIEFDKTNLVSRLTKILAQQDSLLLSNISSNTVDAILNHIAFLIKDVKNDGIISREIITVLRLLSENNNIEKFLVDLLEILNTNKDRNYDISPDICRLLQNNISPLITEKLKGILLDRTFESRIRRFVIDSLDYREFDNRKFIFSSLLEEEIEGSENGVFFYAKSWYRLIEDLALRNQLLGLFDEETNDHVQNLLVDTLAFSEIEDTGKLLFDRFQNKTYSEHITNWLCRAICTLNYQPAIPKFIRLLIDDPTSPLADSILIGLGEMQAKETMPALFEIIMNLNENVDTWWLSMSFSDIANEEDYETLNKLFSKSQNPHTEFFIALTLSKTRIKKYHNTIINALKNISISINKRSRILSEWSHNLTSSRFQGYSKVDLISKSEALGKINNEEINTMYEFFNDNNELSIDALAVLLNFEQNIPKLATSMKKNLPKLNYKFNTRSFHLINIDNLENLSVELNPWLCKDLMKPQWKNKIYLFNCIQFAGIFGDIRVLESIRFNRDEIIKFHEYGESYIQYIEHTIRTAQDKVRLLLDDI